jgi:hypothetical protein
MKISQAAISIAALAFLTVLPLATGQTAQSDNAREIQIINRNTTICTAIAMRSPYQLGSTGAALIHAAMSSCPWHGPPQTYDEYIKAILAGAREFDQAHPDAR